MMNKQYVDIKSETIERKAPTDESVRLLSEMQDKAVRSIIERVNVTNNTFNFSAIFFKDELRGDVKFEAKFMLNGETHFVESFIYQEDVRQAFEVSNDSLTTTDAFQMALRNALSKVIAEWIPIVQLPK